jgi:hypothetical protein
MTERFEIENIREGLQSLSDELKYEAATRPGEGLKVEVLFLSTIQKIQEAIQLLKKATKLI